MAIGNEVRSKYKIKRNTNLIAKTGAFFAYTLEHFGIIRTFKTNGKSGHQAYAVEVLNDEAIVKMWESIKVNKTISLPALTPYSPWASCTHESGVKLIKTRCRSVLKKVTPETHPIVFECVNRSQAVGWNINGDIHKIQLWALKNKAEAFSDIWNSQNPEAKSTKLREATSINNIAKQLLNKTFYHLYYLDFRGRKYPTTTYLHEQGTDQAKGLLLRNDKKKIGKEGFFWLLVSVASNWAGNCGREDGAKTDKIPLQERYEWVLDNEEIFLSYADNPKINTGWMAADKPWQLLAACNELKKLREWQYTYGVHYNRWNDFDYESGLECFIDGL